MSYNPSNPPTNISVFKVSGGTAKIGVHATFHQANSLPATYARCQLSKVNDFSTIDYDSGQVGINPIQDGEQGSMFFVWAPADTGTYYIRLCFWDDANYTKTGWTVWNGTTVGESSEQTATVRPISNYSVHLQVVGADTNYEAVDDVTPNDDTDYVKLQNGQSLTIDKYNAGTSGIDETNFERIEKVTVYIRARSAYADSGAYVHIYLNSGDSGNISAGQASYTNFSQSWLTNPDTGADWQLSEVNSLKLGVGLDSNNQYQYCTQVYAVISYYNYTFSYSPTNDNFIVGFPSVTSLTFKQDNEKINDLLIYTTADDLIYTSLDEEIFIEKTAPNEKFTFYAVVQDTYSKPPRTTLTIGNKSYVMELVSRTGNYAYTYKKTVEVEEGDYEYHVEVGNVWTVLIDKTYYLHVHYNLNDKKVEIFWENKKINAWDITLEENLLPDLNKVEFSTDEDITTGDLRLVSRIRTLKSYPLQIESKSLEEGHYHITAVSTAKRDLDETVSISTKSMNSKDLIQSLLPDYIIQGNIDEAIVLQQFVDEKISFILNKVLILNGAYAFLRNKRIFIHLPSEDSRLTLFKNDVGVSWSEDRKNILNHLKEYYKIIQYPVPASLFTNYDSANWNGTVSDVTHTTNLTLPPSVNFYMLKGNGTIYRTVDFLFSNFDHFRVNWSPDSATSLEIRLETNSSNYYTYTRNFSGQKGAGFILQGNSMNDEVTKTITFSTKYISKVEGYVTQPCRVKVILKKAGSIVASTDYQSVSSHFWQNFQNIQCDEIDITFTNLYVVNNSYGINCSQLKIVEYVQEFEATGTREHTTWSQNFSGRSGINGVQSAVQLTKGQDTTITGDATAGAVPPLEAGERYLLRGGGKVWVDKFKNASGTSPDDWHGYMWVSTDKWVGDGKLQLAFSQYFKNNDYYKIVIYSPIYWNVSASKLKTTTTGEYVWIHKNYAWSETYNLFDNIDIPLSSFSKVGSPTNQINTIRLIASGDNFYDTIEVYSSNPAPKYVEVQDENSINDYGDKFQARKMDGWSSEESARAFANALVNLLKDPIVTYEKTLPINTSVDCGDMVKADGANLPIKRIVYDFEKRVKTIYVGKAISNMVEFLKAMARRIETLEKNIM